ncbi:Hypothetical predicted protein [Octopus vulgaris]|uniref:Uncharacterized protein n=1 Tax=Octopus vulgaris TaxID=6645 RepID=A0AA36FCY4_OCTVU|nr:Hypothetical predicted protein [Octopus vulgaris]
MDNKLPLHEGLMNLCQVVDSSHANKLEDIWHNWHGHMQRTRVENCEEKKGHGEEEMVRIVCQVASKKEMKLEYGHECTFYLNIYNETNFTLEKYTCFKYVTSKSKKIPAPSINIKRHEIQSLKPFLNMSLKKYDRRLVKILKAYKKYEIGVIYIVNVEVIELESPRQKPIHCMTVILYEPWRYNRYKLIDDDCHSQSY